jgi:outer membrane protein assembly factor BamA
MTPFILALLLMQAPERIGEIRVHGNHTTPDADILALAALAVGDPATDERLAAAERRLRDSGRFAGVELRRRFRSIDDPSDILIMLVVDEHDAVSRDAPIPGPLARMRSAGMWLPILNYADGYGLTYGARTSFIDPLGVGSRISIPASWGGERKVGVEIEAGQMQMGAALSRRVNPHFDAPDTRREVSAQIERPLRSWLRAGLNGRVGTVAFGNASTEWHRAAGAHLIVDTRLDPVFPRNAVHAIATVDRIGFGGGAATRLSADVRGYAAAGGPVVIALRGAVSRASAPLPPSEQLLLGGSSSLRGYRTGHRAGDGLALVSAEARVPLTSPLSVGRFGVKGFVDAATVWDAGTTLRDRTFERGVGGGLYFGAALFNANVDVAWPRDGKPRVHLSLVVGRS